MSTDARDQSSATTQDELLSVEQITQELKISRRTFYRWRELHITPPSLRLPNGEIRIFRSVFTEWLKHLGEQVA